MPTLEETRDFIQLRDMNFPRRSRVKEKDLIEFLYYRKKAEEIMARYRGSEWVQLLKDMQTADAGRTSENNALV